MAKQFYESLSRTIPFLAGFLYFVAKIPR